MRIHFKPTLQKEFLDRVIDRIHCISLRGLLQFGISTNYTNLKNYYTERRTLPQELFEELCHLSKIDPETLEFEIKQEQWGQIKGGKTSTKI